MLFFKLLFKSSIFYAGLNQVFILCKENNGNSSWTVGLNGMLANSSMWP